MEVALAHSFLATLGRGTEIVPLCLKQNSNTKTFMHESLILIYAKHIGSTGANAKGSPSATPEGSPPSSGQRRPRALKQLAPAVTQLCTPCLAPARLTNGNPALQLAPA
jgi:hypothetical protein